MEDKILCNVSDLEPIADAVREKENTNKLYSVEELKVKVPELIGSGGIELPVLTNPATASDALSGKEFIDGNGKKVTGTIATKTSSNLTANGATVTVPAGYYASQATKSVATATQATPSVSIDSAGKITATSTQSAGYVSAGTKTGTKQLTTQAAKTITPSTSSQTAVASGVYTTGVVTVGAIPTQYIMTTDATAASDDIVTGETAYVNGTKIIGTNPYEKTTTDAQITEIEELIEELEAVLDGKSVPGEVDIGTCTVTISTYDNYHYFYLDLYSKVQNGSILYSNPSNSHSQSLSSITLTDVACGTPIVIANQNIQGPTLYVSDNIQGLHGSGGAYIVIAPLERGALGTITFNTIM